MNTDQIKAIYQSGIKLEDAAKVTGASESQILFAIRDTLSPIFDDILRERLRQNRLHPSYPVSDMARYVILGEEVGEIAKALNDGALMELIKEVTEVAAVCVRWLEKLRAEYPIELSESSDRRFETLETSNEPIIQLYSKDEI